MNEKEKRYALLIGNSKFPKATKGLPELKCPENDVDGLHDILSAKDLGNFQEVEPLKNGSHYEVLRAIHSTIKKVTKDDLALIYYSGHGKLDFAGHLRLATSDTEIDLLESTSVWIEQIKHLINAATLKKVILILDCCYSGAVGRNFKGGDVEEQLRQASEAKGFYILTASTSIEVATEKEGDQYGLFTKHIIEGISEGNADVDNDGLICMDDLYEYVSNQVKSESSQKPMKWALGVEGKSLVISRSSKSFKKDHIKFLRKEIVNNFEDILAEDIVEQVLDQLRLDKAEILNEDKDKILLINRLVKGEIKAGPFSTQWPKLMGQVPFPEKPLVRNIQAAPEVSTPTLPDKTIIKLKEFEFKTPILNRRGEQVKVLSGKAKYYEEALGNGIVLEMVQIPEGSFLMGSKEGEGNNTERPQHKVTVPSFYMGKYQVTQEQWKAVMGNNPSYFEGDRLPVERIKWEQAKEFCKKLSEKTGKEYRLPSEAEWEYACRAGTETPFAFGETITPEIVNYNGNYPYADALKGEYRQKTVEVGSLGVANQFGLYDMHGNVWEWCEDVWHDNYNGAPRDGSAWVTGGDASRHIVRGGSWFSNSTVCRSALRNLWYVTSNYIGFRVVVLSRTL